MNRNSKLVLRPFGNQVQKWICIASCLLLVPAASAAGGSREAVKKALAATVAVEWRADKKADQPAEAPSRTTGHFHEEQRVEIDPETGQETVRTRIVGAQSQPIPKPDLSLSSGVLLSADGTIATFSREDGNGRYTIYLSDGRTLPASILVDDRRTGLRLLKIDARDLPHLVPAESQAEVGDQVFATFCTDRHERAAAQGMISARLRGALWANSVQVDLAAGPMSAGGPLVDAEGRLVGLLAGKSASPDQPNAGTVATPLDAVSALLKARQGENTVVVQRGLLGIQLNSKSDGGQEQVVVQVLQDSPAEAAGVRDGDELVAIDGHKVTSPAEAVALVARHALGEKVSVTLRRDGAEKETEITIRRPAPDAGADSNAAPSGSNRPLRVTANLVHPGKLYVVTQDGKLIATGATEQQLEPLRKQWQKVHGTVGAPLAIVAEPVPNVMRVERSGLEKKLEEFGRNVESLQKQVQSLTEEIKSLREKLAEQK